jgi:hypothetical protein
MKDKTASNLYKSYEGLRKYPRICIDANANLKLSSDLIIEVKAYNISQDGVQIRCDRDTAMKIHPSGKFIKKGKGPLGTLSFNLSFESKNVRIITQCQIYYLAVIHETGEIAFGCGFKGMLAGQSELLEEFIIDSIRPL